MTNEEMQRLGNGSAQVTMASFGAWTTGAQAIAAEIADYSKKSAAFTAAAWEQLMGARSMETAMQVQAEYLKSSLEDFMAEAGKIGALYVDLAKQAYKPFDAVAKATGTT